VEALVTLKPLIIGGYGQNGCPFIQWVFLSKVTHWPSFTCLVWFI